MTDAPCCCVQEGEGVVVSSHVEPDCTFQQLLAAVTAELEQALADNPRLLQAPASQEGSNSFDRTKVRTAITM